MTPSRTNMDDRAYLQWHIDHDTPIPGGDYTIDQSLRLTDRPDQHIVLFGPDPVTITVRSRFFLTLDRVAGSTMDRSNRDVTLHFARADGSVETLMFHDTPTFSLAPQPKARA